MEEQDVNSNGLNVIRYWLYKTGKPIMTRQWTLVKPLISNSTVSARSGCLTLCTGSQVLDEDHLFNLHN